MAKKKTINVMVLRHCEVPRIEQIDGSREGIRSVLGDGYTSIHGVTPGDTVRFDGKRENTERAFAIIARHLHGDHTPGSLSMEDIISCAIKFRDSGKLRIGALADLSEEQIERGNLWDDDQDAIDDAVRALAHAYFDEQHARFDERPTWLTRAHFMMEYCIAHEARRGREDLRRRREESAKRWAKRQAENDLATTRTSEAAE